MWVPGTGNLAGAAEELDFKFYLLLINLNSTCDHWLPQWTAQVQRQFPYPQFTWSHDSPARWQVGCLRGTGKEDVRKEMLCCRAQGEARSC